ncbi:hypothetical protein LNQ82_08725 [Conchiformibius steedae DSM 2580]|uniref:DUF6973 domain-containing protein n=1 Tax=Conchiformibius steedae DSM 2580 TaxID=1121352 RepID=A0AAE9HSG6_9NEIS|nr:hypothetical protein [Conchiformibius steedae]QMT32652.1 hypothetical protein H3L98_05825 [Conchiformibius steedae]URD67259.1 hypothetical protein LNQ82_08725 [Conchiformibius steedae DSM 2580]
MSLKIALLCLTLGNNACAPFKDKPELAHFSLRHPIAAAAIGQTGALSTNITSNAVRLSQRSGLDNRANGDGRGTQMNALRHSLWQAAIAARFGDDIARQAGNAYEKNPVWQHTLDYPDRYRADEAADLRNNAIGRRIGLRQRGQTMHALANALLNEFRQNGLWTAAPVKENGRTQWRIAQTRISETEYRRAVQNLAALDGNGMTAAERQQLAQQPARQR